MRTQALPDIGTDTARRLVQEPTAATRALIEEVRQDLDAMRPALQAREEALDLFLGDHWKRSMVDPDTGKTLSEEEFIRNRGQVPWVMNHVSPTLRQMLGQYLQNKSERMAFAVDRDADDAAEQMTLALRYVRADNEAKEHEVDQFLEQLIGGLVVWKSGAEWDARRQRNRVVFQPVAVERFFFTRTAHGRRLEGLTRIGEVLDVEMEELVSRLATSPAHARALREACGKGDERWRERQDAMPYRRDQRRTLSAATLDEELPGDLVRVIDVWTLEYRSTQVAYDPTTGEKATIDWTDAEIIVEQQERDAAGVPRLELSWSSAPVWVHYLLTPSGHTLQRQENPYWHEDHPYTVGYGMLARGEWFGLVKDIADPQRLVNRLTIGVDQLIAGSAKGVLILDEESLKLENGDLSLDDVASAWARFNGVIALKLKPGVNVPQQITANAVPAEVFQWMDRQKAWIQEISGVNDALLGQSPNAGTPASLYGMQQQQAATTTAVYFDAFFRTLARLDRKLLKVILQFFDEPMNLRDEASQGFVQYRPEQVRDADYDVVVGDSADTATYRQLFEADMQGWLASGYLTFNQFLEASSHPRANQILRLIERTNPLMQGGAAAQGALATADPALVSGLMAAAQAGDAEAATLLAQAQQAAPPMSPAAPIAGDPLSLPVGTVPGGAGAFAQA